MTTGTGWCYLLLSRRPGRIEFGGQGVLRLDDLQRRQSNTFLQQLR